MKGATWNYWGGRGFEQRQERFGNGRSKGQEAGYMDAGSSLSRFGVREVDVEYRRRIVAIGYLGTVQCRSGSSQRVGSKV